LTVIQWESAAFDAMRSLSICLPPEGEMLNLARMKQKFSLPICVKSVLWNFINQYRVPYLGISFEVQCLGRLLCRDCYDS